MTGIDDAPRGRGAFVALVGGVLLVLCTCLALGAWQWQRLQWKQALIERVESRAAAAPSPPPGPADWPAVDRDGAEYRRVSAQGRFDHARETLVQASTELGPGWWVLTPLRTDEGWWLWVNRGYVPMDRRDPSARGDTPADDTGQVVGLLRLDEPGGGLLRDNDPAADRWYSRDLQAIGAARGLAGTAVAPYFIDEVAGTVTAARWPRPGLTVLRFSNNHLQYALTWFAMAAGAAGLLVFLLRDDRRQRRAAAAPHRSD